MSENYIKKVRTVSVGTEPIETKPVETKPVETKKVEPKPVETKKVGTKKVEPKPVETKKVATKVETIIVEPKPVEIKKVETKKVETKKVEPIINYDIVKKLKVKEKLETKNISIEENKLLPGLFRLSPISKNDIIKKKSDINKFHLLSILENLNMNMIIIFKISIIH